ncbi:unnamed protein product [Linum tenue]|uniref:Pentatricopeptide repeat-containing protein n=1 Tax=Linum tenue TaxID=586396 RepID=A0AAV0N3H0_9ROSI|nr:unnamed protein product [Linum tenue]
MYNNCKFCGHRAEMATQHIFSVTIPSPTTWRRPFFLSSAVNLLPICFTSSLPILVPRRRQSSATSYVVTADAVPTILVDSSSDDHHHRLRDLVHTLESDGASPIEILTHHGDWPAPHFWAVVKFLQLSSQSHLILQVFEAWKALDESRISESNYEQIIGILSEEGQTEDAISGFVEMKGLGFNPSVHVYNSIIHGLAKVGRFDHALTYLDEMKQIMNLLPNSQTFDRLITAYGIQGMYDEIGTCVKRMAVEGCPPTAITYNLLITEYARAGLLTRMETTNQIMRSKRMDLQPRALMAMLEAYVNFGIVEKADNVLSKARRSRMFLKEGLVRKLAVVYIENRMFSRLDELGGYLASLSDRNDIVWLLNLLSHACVSSRKGVDATLGLMEELSVSWNVTVVNTLLFMYLKMKDFTRLRSLLFVMIEDHGVKPDIVTVGIVFTAGEMGFGGTVRIIEKWRKMGLLDRGVEMGTDPLVVVAFGKGRFLKNCEDMYLSLDPVEREQKKWTYSLLIDLVSRSMPEAA